MCLSFQNFISFFSSHYRYKQTNKQKKSIQKSHLSDPVIEIRIELVNNTLILYNLSNKVRYKFEFISQA